MATESEEGLMAHVAVPTEEPVPPAPHPVKRTIYKKRRVCDHPGCGMTFQYPSEVVKHYRKHTGEKPFACEVCGMTFAHGSSLCGHKRTHSGEKPFACEVCDMTFSHGGSLSVHKRRHSGEKPYVCEVCGNGFTNSSHLQRHKRVHSGEKPYVCEQCGTGFADSSHLHRHKQAHTGEKPYVCEDCNAGFYDSNHLARHKGAIHTARGQQRQKKKEECVARFLTDAGITFEREVVVNFCGEAERRHARVDFTIYKDWGTDIIECDEEQHGHYTIGCDAGRMLNVFAEILKRGDRAGKLRFIRYNPDAYKVDGVKQKTLQRDRQAALLKVLNSPPDQQFSVSYLFYDRTGPLPDVCVDDDYPSTLRAIASAGD